MSAQNSSSNVFLNNGSGAIDSLVVNNLTANKPVRSSAGRQLVSGDTLIGEVSGLQTALTTKARLDFVEGTAPANPDVGNLRLYAKLDGAIYTRDSAGNEVALGGGGVSGSQWQFDTSISADPAAGNFRFNNATPASVSKIVINVLDKDGNSYRPLLDQLTPGDAIYLESTDLSNNKFYTISSAIDLGTYFSADVVLQQQTDTANYTLNQNVKVNLFVSGNSFDQSLNTTDAVQFQRLTISDTAAPSLELKDSTALNIGTVDASLDMLDGSDTVAASLTLTNGDLTLDNANSGKKTLVKGDIAELQSATTTLTLDNTISQVSTDANLILINNANPTLVLNDTDDLANDVDCTILFQGTDTVSATIGHSAGNLELTNAVPNGVVSLTTESGNSLILNSESGPLSAVVSNTAMKIENSSPALIISDSDNTKAGMLGNIFFNGTDGNASKLEQKSDNLTLQNTSATGNVILKAGSESLTIDADTNLSSFSTVVNAVSYSENNDPGLLVRTGLGGSNNFLAGGSYSVLTSTNNISLGNNMTAATNGGYNVVIAPNDVNALTTGSDNIVVGGRGSAGSLNSGNSNVIVGSNCGGSLTVGNSNIVVGRNADIITDANSAVCVGAGAIASTDSIALGAGSIAVDREFAIGSSNSSKSIQRIKPGDTQTCDLGSASNEFKDAYLSGSIILSAPPELKAGVIPPTTITYDTINTANLVVGSISADPSLTEVTFNQTIIVEQGITVPPGAPPADVDEMDVKTLVVKNATNSSTLTYSATENKTLDLAKLETVNDIQQEFPDAASSATTPAGYIITTSSENPTFDAWKLFDASPFTEWATPVRYTDGSGVSLGTGGSTNGNYFGEWVDIQSPDPLSLAEYSVTCREDVGANSSQAPVDFRVYGSNDKSTWTQLDERTNQTPWGIGETKTYTVVAGASYTYFRFAVNKTNGLSSLAFTKLIYTSAGACPTPGCLHTTSQLVVDSNIIGGVNLDIAGTATIGTSLTASNISATVDINTPSLLVKNGANANTLTYSGTENKTLDLVNIESSAGGSVVNPSIVMTSNNDPPYTASASTAGATDQAWNAFADANWCSATPNAYTGAGNTYTGAFTTDGYGGEWVQLQSTSNMYISEWDMKITYQAGAPKAFRLYKSNDGTTWTQIDERTNQTGWAVNEVRTFTLASSHVAKYCRVAVNSTNGDITSACIQDLEFRGTAPEQTIINTNLLVNGTITSTSSATLAADLTRNIAVAQCSLNANTLTTAFAAANLYTAIVSPLGFSADLAHDFVITPVGGQVNYTGTLTKLFAVNASWTWEAEGKNEDIVMGLHKNGSVLPSCQIRSILDDTNSYPRAAALNQIVSLSNGDSLSVKIKNQNDTNPAIIEFMQFCVYEIGAPSVPPLMTERIKETEEKESSGWTLF